MRRFVDYWSEHGSWEALPNPQRIATAMRINKVTLDFWATLNDPMRLDDLADLAVPFRRVIFKEISPLIRFHCDARNHLKSGGNDLRERVCA